MAGAIRLPLGPGNRRLAQAFVTHEPWPFEQQRVVEVTGRQSFVIVTSQRTGSTLLVRSLDGDTRVFCAGEIFFEGTGIYHPEWRFPCCVLGSRNAGRFVDRCFGQARAIRHLRKFYEHAGPGAAAVGFKLMISQLRRRSALMATLASEGVRRIFLIRASVFATALSYCTAMATGRFHGDRVDRQESRDSFAVDPGEFATYMRRCQKDRADVMAAHRVHGGLLLVYEDLVRDWPGTMNCVGQFIGVEEIRVQQALRRLSDDVPAMRISNLEVLRRNFADEQL